MTREEAIKRLKEYEQYAYGIWHNEEEDTNAFDMAIETLLTDVVRCKDCRYWQEQEEGIVECSVCTRIHDLVFEMGADGFCSKGQRR